MDKFRGKNIAVLGCGIEGKSVLDFLDNEAKITVFDKKERSKFEHSEIEKYENRGVEFKFGEADNLEQFDIVFRSPSIHPDSPVLAKAREKGIEITSATKLFFELCNSQIIGVTGTKGKGTTSALIYEILKKEGKDVYLGGNIGNSPLAFLNKLQKDSIVVLELSSFQLIDLQKSPHIAVILMTTSEHLDYHKDVYEYISAKRNILAFQTDKDFAVVNKDYPASNESDIHTEGKVYKFSREQSVLEGCFVKEDKIILKMYDREEEIFDINDIFLPGKHNLENVCAAIVASLLAGAGMNSITQTLKTFKGLPHRIELVKEVSGVKYYDDSFSTTPETAIAAIEALDQPKILILGGSSKNSNFEELGKVISESNSIKAIIGIGDEWNRIKASIKYKVSSIKLVEGLKTMEEVVKEASEIAHEGDVVLLSPACASFGMFKNYKERGQLFQEAVRNL